MEAHNGRIAWIAGLAAATASGLVLGITGVATTALFFAVFLMPGYSLISRLNLDAEEKILFATMASIGLLPLLVWLLNKAVPSFRAATIIIAVLLTTAGIAAHYLRKK